MLTIKIYEPWEKRQWSFKDTYKISRLYSSQEKELRHRTRIIPKLKHNLQQHFTQQQRTMTSRAKPSPHRHLLMEAHRRVFSCGSVDSVRKVAEVLEVTGSGKRTATVDELTLECLMLLTSSARKNVMTSARDERRKEAILDHTWSTKTVVTWLWINT